MALSKLDKWKTLGINEAIRASKYEMPINPSLLTSLLCFWSPATNTFSFPEGFMTPTVADIFTLLGLRLMGALAHPLMAVGTGPDNDVLNGVPLSYNDFLKHMKGSGASSSYFPSIAPELHPTIKPWFYGEAWMHARYPTEVPSFPTCFKLFNDSTRRSLPEDFMPFEAKRYGSEDFHQFSSQGFFRGDTAWGACLQSKDLVVIRFANADVEVYYPSLVARQFALVQLWWESYMANFNNEDDLIEALNGCCPGFLMYQLAGAGIEHIASYVTPQPLQQISPSGKKVGGGSSSQKYVTAEDAAFKKAKKSLQLQAPLLRLPAPFEQGTRTSTKRKTIEVEEVDPTISLKGAKPSGKRLIKTVAKKSTAKKAKVIEVVPDSSINEVEPLEDELNDTATLSNLMRKIDKQKQVLSAKAKAEDAKRKRLEVEEEKKKQADKAEEERVVEIERMLEIKKKEKALVDQKRQQELEKKKKEEKEEKKNKKGRQRGNKTSIEAVTSSIEAAAPLAPNMLESLGDIDKLLEGVSLTLQQCQTRTKTSSTSTPLEPSTDQLQATINQLKELLQKPVGLVLLNANLVDQFQLGGRALLDIQTLQSEINDLEMLPLMSWAGLFAAFKEL
uniref:Aminotransferase-like plant mobile domain-containing protein n=1 Tax=Fagus sylvatica TaxID=28930 RepID=A0A2N9GZC7_FAGSY